jgi:26S proteasome regulatory subunit, ATPase 3, interacting protein
MSIISPYLFTQIQRAVQALEPLRSGKQLISAGDLAILDVDWDKWHAQWVKRKRIFETCVSFWIKSSLSSPFSRHVHG